jgi:predicted membrane protein
MELSVYVTLTMRSEYLGACALIEGLAEAISTGMFLTPRMTRGQCRAAIVGPATVCGIEIEEGLVNRLLNDLAAFAPWDDRSGLDQLDRLVRRADQLPLLQYCLNRMWVRAVDESRGERMLLRLTDYEGIGGLGGALNAHGDQILATLGEGRRAVAEAIFRALTDGSTIADAVRRPTRFGELIAICGGDEPSVRAVVDAFRAPGCNFLSPEFDPKNPEPIRAETFVDITHESLIRQWKTMSAWLEREARAGRRWRRLKDRLEDGQPLTGAELANTLAWRDEQKPNAAWARRYGGNFEAMINFIEKSVQLRRRLAPAMLPVFGITAFWTTLLVVYGLTAITFGVPNPWPWPFNVGVFSATIASTCAFGLWRYTDLEPGRAVLAGVTICVVDYAGGAALVVPLIRHNMTESAALNLWAATLLAPCTFFGMAIFEKTFRRLSVWLWLTIILAVPIRFLDSSSLSEDVRTFIIIIILMSWFTAIGYQLRQGSEPLNTFWRGIFVNLELPAFGLAIYFMIAMLARVAIQIIYGSANQPWWWPVNLGLISGGTAITLAFGLSRHSGLQRRRALLAGGTVFLLEVAAGAVLIGILLSHNVALRHAFHWWGITLYAPCALTAMAIFEQAFRRVLVWLLLTFLFAGPYGLLIWAYDSLLISISEDVLGFSVLIIISVWFAAVGYQLRRKPGRRRLEADAVPASRPAMREAAAYPS